MLKAGEGVAARDCSGHDVGQKVVANGEIMTEAASQNKEMPDGMMEKEAFPGVEDQSQAVKNPSCQQQAKPPRWNQRDCGLDGENDQPAHEKIDERRQNLESVDEKNLEEDTANGQAPHRAEKDPPPVAPQGNQSDRRVGPSDQKVDSRMVKDLEYMPQAFVKFENVVQGKNRIGDDQTRSVDGETHDIPAVTVAGCPPDQHNQPGDAEGKSDGGSNSVGDLDCFVKALVHDFEKYTLQMNA